MGVMGSFLKVTGAATLIVGIQLLACLNTSASTTRRMESELLAVSVSLRPPLLSQEEPEPPPNSGPGSSNSGGTQLVKIR